MKRDWEDIKWIFEPSGSLRDIYVQDVSLADWEKVVDLLNENYPLKYGIAGEEKSFSQIDKQDIISYLTDETGEMYCRSVTIDLGGVHANCHFFLSEQIEFDINPKGVTSFEDFEKVVKFMQSISWTLEQQVTLTDENTPEFPLIKVDLKRNIHKVLTLKEALDLRSNRNSLIAKIAVLKVSLEMKLFPKEFKDQILESASETYKPVKKSKNIW
ncbi:hypothetical protein TH63_10245 [Rufibacter radiotolerans]|uniref:Uncharacterized protein n=1 Tax=Rufibacter radiotolerans TaxID=1379910 RepID=A0A0H4VQB8_9BACT|nr:hypothetical protein [Rufibacter radiotolerans]AKQ45939.1 hypothetical protein TH63_10245 [Rufibacter radiotolerans]